MGTLKYGAFALLFFVISLVNGQRSNVPVINNPGIVIDRVLPETFPVGQSIGKLDAYDPDGKAVYFFLAGVGGEYFTINTDTGVITVKKELDFETDFEITFEITVADEDGQQENINGRVIVIDENDNEPEFTDYTIYKDLSEDTPPGFVVSPIVVNDDDTKNSILTVVCNRSSELFSDACDKFGIRSTSVSNKFWIGEVYLAQPLDFEQRSSYAIQLTAFDGKYYESNEVHIEVQDINDSPPRFLLASPQQIPEEEPIGTVIETVLAEDQDSTSPHPIRYELVGANTDRFQIGAVTGSISNKVRLDYDDVNFPKGLPFELTVKARELLPNGTLGSDSITTATIVIKVTVVDINDNTPTFDQTSYTATMKEDIVGGSYVPGLEMIITDIDSGTFNQFFILGTEHRSIFAVLPTLGSGSAAATLVVVNAGPIDYESGPRQYIIPVEARQINVPNPQRTGTATVTVNIQNVNDIIPEFSDPSYTRIISETDPSGTFIIDLDATDPEAGPFGTAGIKYQLFGNIPPLFTLDTDTGVVRIAPCATPGEFPCIDFERKARYTLTVSATDNNGAPDGKTRSVVLTIIVTDVNDVQPAIEAKYERSIYENERVTINPLRIDATDPDTVGGPLTYSIIGDTTGLWQVTVETDPSTGQQYGNITALKPILYTDAPNQATGEFRFAVQVEDSLFRTTADVIITVIDINNNAPVFSPREFVERIPESTGGDIFVITVTASDGDAPSTGNGVLDISVGTGGRGKFYARTPRQQGSEFVADIYTTPEATFNFETDQMFEMALVVRDRGTPSSKSGTGKLTVFITDINDKDPIIRPTFESVTISENTPVDRSIHQVTATDADDTAILRYTFSASSATDGNGAQVDATIFDYRNLFRMDSDTGIVFVNQPLDRDRTASITYDLLVRDVAANPVQSGTGILLIKITEFNDQPPQFNSTQYIININEELNINSFIQSLYCTDEDDKIESYSLTQDDPRRPNFFSFYAQSGAMLVENRIDYDPPGNIEKIELTAFCKDTGTPQRTASAKVTVIVNNINDNYPVFEQPLYRKTIPEGRINGSLGLQIRATDIDKGDYGVVKYRLLNSTGSAYDRFFSINEDTAEITILPGAVFDREVTGFLGIQVEAYDSPLDASVRRRTSVPVYITIEDVNDNCPEFRDIFYTGMVPESAEEDTSIIDIIATDRDEGINARIVYAIKPNSGDPAESTSLFSVGRTNGRILVRGLLRRKTGLYNFTVTATDMGGSNLPMACTVEVPVSIRVQESLNRAPEWIRPPRKGFVIYVLESQYEGMLVYSAKAKDENVGENGVIDYYILDADVEKDRTAEFRINRVTGVIRAEVEFDREQKDTYFLTLLARDRGNPAASSETTLTIIILDVDDNDPKFPMKDGQVMPLVLPEPGAAPITDGQPPPNNGILGSCNATDADSDHENNRIIYEILSAQDEVRNLVTVDRDTCLIRLTEPVDYEAHPTLEFDILARNEKNDDTVRRYRTKREVNPSILHVILRITDQNDNAPVFTSRQYFGCISVDAPYRKPILEVSARDVDAGDNTRIRYSIAQQSTGFGIDSIVGTIFNTRSFRSGDQRQHELTVSATDNVNPPARATALIFVTSPSNVVKLKVNRALTDVQPFSQQLVNTLTSSSADIAFACIDRMRNHINDDGDEIETATDVFVTAVRQQNGVYEIFPAQELVDQIDADDETYSAVYVTAVEVEGDDDGFTLEEDAVLAILIISLLLIVLALVLFCVACYCIRKKDRKKKRKIRSERHAIVQPQAEPVETSFNPVYENSPPQEPVYTTVQKVRPQASPIAPVVIPAPQKLEPLASEAPHNLEPAEPVEVEDPVPVIETEVLPDTSPQPERVIHPPQFQPEYEDRIETVVVDDPPELPPPPPEVADDNTIEVEIDDSPLPSPAPSSPSGPNVTTLNI